MASAAGIKWVLADVRRGSALEYLVELWGVNRGWTREALAVVLEGSTSSLELDELGDDLLLEAVTLALHLRAWQWADQVGKLSSGRLVASCTDELHDVVIRYEMEAASAGQVPRIDAFHRSVARELQRIRKGRMQRYWPRTTRILLEFAGTVALQGDIEAYEWLGETGRGANDGFLLAHVLDVIKARVLAGENSDTHSAFCLALGLGDEVRAKQVWAALCDDSAMLVEAVVGVISAPRLLAENVGSWGATALKVLAGVISAQQKKNWPSRVRSRRSLAEVLGQELEAGQEFEPDYDEMPELSVLSQHVNATARLYEPIRQAFDELAAKKDSQGFLALARHAIAERFSAVIAIPLLAMYDAIRNGKSNCNWWGRVSGELLEDEWVCSLPSLRHERRLLRQAGVGLWSDDERRRVVEAIRRAGNSHQDSVSEFADVVEWNVLTADELQLVEEARLAGNVGEARDRRVERPFRGRSDWRPDEDVPEFDWPHHEDFELLRTVTRRGGRRQSWQ